MKCSPYPFLETAFVNLVFVTASLVFAFFSRPKQEHLLLSSEFEKIMTKHHHLASAVFLKSPDFLTIQKMTPHEAVARLILPDHKIMLLSKTGIVFESSSASEETSSLPQVTGLQNIDKKALSTVLAAINSLKKEGFRDVPIHYSAMNGISMVLHHGFSKDALTVQLGGTPYEKKLLRLKSLLEKASQKHQVLEQIDLTFKNKAFVKYASRSP